MKKLYLDGILVSYHGKDKTFSGGLVAFLADNAASRLVGGFKGSMSFALRNCRSCMTTLETMQDAINFKESNHTLRNPETHFEQCSKLVGPLRDHFSTAYGVNRLSILEEVPGFSVATCLPHDIMHNLF